MKNSKKKRWKKIRAPKERSHGGDYDDDDGISNSAKTQSGKSNWNNGFSLSPLYVCFNFHYSYIVPIGECACVYVCSRIDVRMHRVSLCWSFDSSVDGVKRAPLFCCSHHYSIVAHSNRICNSFPWSFHPFSRACSVFHSALACTALLLFVSSIVQLIKSDFGCVYRCLVPTSAKFNVLFLCCRQSTRI